MTLSYYYATMKTSCFNIACLCCECQVHSFSVGRISVVSFEQLNILIVRLENFVSSGDGDLIVLLKFLPEVHHILVCFFNILMFFRKVFLTMYLW